jgi:hypothetical protein
MCDIGLSAPGEATRTRSSAKRILRRSPGTSSTFVCKTGERTFLGDVPAVTASPAKSMNTHDASKRGLRPVGRYWRSGIPGPFCRRHPSTAPCREQRGPGRQLRDGRFGASRQKPPLCLGHHLSAPPRREHRFQTARDDCPQAGTNIRGRESTRYLDFGRYRLFAWESNQIARSDIYAALKLPVEPCASPAAFAAMNRRRVSARRIWTTPM